MAMTVAERQRKFRAARKQKGLIRKDSWTNVLGLIAPRTEKGEAALMTLKELEKELGKLLKDYDDTLKTFAYAEIFEYAKIVDKRFRRIYFTD